MKKHTAAWFLFWIMLIVLLSIALFTSVQGQERDSISQRDTVVILRVTSCPCDSAFIRRTNGRLDRQTDVNSIIFTALKDHAQTYYRQQHQIDSLRTLVQKWALPTEPTLLRKKKKQP